MSAVDATVEGFRAIYPEFDDPVATDAQVSYALSLAMEIQGCSLNAVYALTAHILALEIAEGTGGDTPATAAAQTMSKIKVGRVETTFDTSVTNAGDDYYDTTPYGKRYMVLRDAANRRFVTRVY